MSADRQLEQTKCLSCGGSARAAFFCKGCGLPVCVECVHDGEDGVPNDEWLAKKCWHCLPPIGMGKRKGHR